MTATLEDGTAGTGSLQALVTLAEVRGPITPHGGAAATSSGKWHTSGNLSASSGEMLLGVYVAMGGDRGTAVGDGKRQVGAVCVATGGLQGAQSYGRGNTAVFTTVSSTAA